MTGVNATQHTEVRDGADASRVLGWVRFPPRVAIRVRHVMFGELRLETGLISDLDKQWVTFNAGTLTTKDLKKALGERFVAKEETE